MIDWDYAVMADGTVLERRSKRTQDGFVFSIQFWGDRPHVHAVGCACPEGFIVAWYAEGVEKHYLPSYEGHRAASGAPEVAS
jgi:hypothetical protein